ncbi:MAG TPA: hypothetical protein VI160_07680 [Gemmatimonadales bacterium]
MTPRTAHAPRNAAAARPAAPAAGSDLARLVETELRLEAMLAAVRTDGARRVAAVRERAQAREAALDAELAAAARELQSEIAAERARREAEISAAGRREAEWYDRVPAGRIAALAADVVQWLIRGEAGA